MNFHLEKITRAQAVDTGMALALGFLLAGRLLDHSLSTLIGIFVLVVNMTAPEVFRPVAKVWLGLALILGSVTSRIILTLIFFLMVTPVGRLRRAMGKDTLRLKSWKRDGNSVFRTRDRVFAGSELERPY